MASRALIPAVLVAVAIALRVAAGPSIADAWRPTLEERQLPSNAQNAMRGWLELGRIDTASRTVSALLTLTLPRQLASQLVVPGSSTNPCDATPIADQQGSLYEASGGDQVVVRLINGAAPSSGPRIVRNLAVPIAELIPADLNESLNTGAYRVVLSDLDLLPASPGLYPWDDYTISLALDVALPSPLALRTGPCDFAFIIPVNLIVRWLPSGRPFQAHVYNEKNGIITLDFIRDPVETYLLLLIAAAPLGLTLLALVYGRSAFRHVTRDSAVAALGGLLTAAVAIGPIRDATVPRDWSGLTAMDMLLVGTLVVWGVTATVVLRRTPADRR